VFTENQCLCGSMPGATRSALLLIHADRAAESSTSGTPCGHPPTQSSWLLARAFHHASGQCNCVLPVATYVRRISGATPTRVGPYLIPPHTPVAIPLYCIQNSSHNWDRASEYLPERWLQVGGVSMCTNCRSADLL
jgi:hypothetical protein